MEGTSHRREFEEAVRNVVAQLQRDGQDRIERGRVEELGERYGLGPEEARELFLKARGDVWRGELVGGEGGSDWEAATLEEVPSTGEKPGGA